MRVAILFTDGVGVGEREPSRNPLARGEFLLSRFLDGGGAALDGGVHVDLDATFGVPGRPQSATNQAALLTGRPIPALLGRHQLGFPTEDLARLIAAHGLPARLTAIGRTVSLVNAYPLSWLEAQGLPHEGVPDGVPPLPARLRRRLRPPASALAFRATGLPFRTFSGLRAGVGLTQDITGQKAASRGWDLPRLTPAQAADRLWASAADYTLFEHFLSDEAGHAQDASAAMDALTTFDHFARAVIARRPGDTLVVITSDHGNIEDLSTRQHTRNPVPLLAFGPGAERFREAATLADAGQAIATLLGAPA